MPVETASEPRRTGLWLLYLAWFYPCWWLAQALVAAAPELLTGAQPLRLGMSPFGVSSRFGGSFEQLALAVLAASLAWLACMAAARRFRGARAIGIYASVWIAYALLGRGLAPLLFRPELRAAPLLMAAIGFAGLVVALAYLPAPLPARPTLSRAAAALLPLAVFHLATLLFVQGSRISGIPYPALAIALALALAVRLRRPETPAAAPAAAMALGLVACLAVFFGARAAGRALEIRTEASRQASLAPVPDPAPLPPAAPDFFYKGVNFTSEWPEPYGSKTAADVLAELPKFGINSVALVPYASQRADEAELQFPLRMERDELILATAKMAHAEGLRVLLKPQIWVRGGGLYPGDLRYDDPAGRARWFASYARFVEHYAKLATAIDADMFCVGVEFAQLTPYEQDWRRIIAIARRRYAGPLVYAANFGQEFESVQFWDALDFIGLDNYYPMPADRSTTVSAAKIEAVHRKFQKPILFTEAGFSTYELSHEKPWEDAPLGRLSPEAQARNVEALLRGFHGAPWLQGIFWWKVGTSGRGGESDGSHILWDKPAMHVIGKWFLSPPGSNVPSQ